MKRFLLILLITVFSLVILMVSSLIFVVYVRPDILVNEQNLEKVLVRTKILDAWKWDKADIQLKPIEWNRFNIKVNFNNLCFTYTHEAADLKSCLEKMHVNADITYDFPRDFSFVAHEPISIVSNYTDIKLKESKAPKETATPPDVWGLWQMVWSKLIPDLDLSFSNITLHTEEKTFKLDLALIKGQNQFTVNSLNFTLIGTPSSIVLKAPDSYKLPIEEPLHINKFILEAPITKELIKFNINGYVESAPFHIDTQITLPITDDISSVAFMRKIALATSGDIKITNVKETLKRYGRPPYNELPAPLNAMDGNIEFNFKTHKTNHFEEVLILGDLSLNLEGKNQAIDIALVLNTPINLQTYKPGQIGVEIKLNKILIQLPKVSKTSLPPQFIPDSRFKSTKELHNKENTKKSGPQIDVQLDALGENAVSLRTDLLDEMLRLNFSLQADQNGLKKGYVKILPLKTTVFKRPIEVKDVLIKFQESIDPTIDAHVEFPLPEYRIFLELEGPVSKPKYAFRSEPPLPQNDIFAVLLFGRPMDDLDAETQGAAGQTNKILSQGVLSLSVLYFLAGSPVEYLAYDPKSQQAQAQFGLGNKMSLRIGAGQNGKTSTGVRRSLGKGWYIDTSVQSSTSTDSNGKDYGVLLERIIAY